MTNEHYNIVQHNNTSSLVIVFNEKFWQTWGRTLMESGLQRPSGGWNVPLVQSNFTQEEAESTLRLPVGGLDKEDILCWHYTDSGVFCQLRHIGCLYERWGSSYRMSECRNRTKLMVCNLVFTDAEQGLHFPLASQFRSSAA